MTFFSKKWQYFVVHRWALICVCTLIFAPTLLAVYYTKDTLFMLSGVDCNQFYFSALDSGNFFKSLLLTDSGYLNTIPRFIAATIIYIFHVKIYFAVLYTALNAMYACFVLSLILHKKFDLVFGAKIYPRLLVLLIALFFPCSHAIAAAYNSSYASIVPILLIFLLLSDKDYVISKVEIWLYLLLLPFLVIGKPIYYPLILFCFIFLSGLALCQKQERYTKLFISVYALLWYALGLIYILYINNSFNGSANAFTSSIKYFPYWVYSAVYFTGVALFGYWFKVANHLKLYFLVPVLSFGLLFLCIGIRYCFDFMVKITKKNLSWNCLVKFLFYILLVITMFGAAVMYRIVMQNNTDWLLNITPFSYDRYYWVIFFVTMLQLLFLMHYFSEKKQNLVAFCLKSLFATCVLTSLSFMGTDRYISIATDPVKLLHPGTICDDPKLMLEVTDYHSLSQDNNGGNRLAQKVKITNHGTNQGKLSNINWSNALSCSGVPLDMKAVKYNIGTYIILGVEKSLKDCDKISMILHAEDGSNIKLIQSHSDLAYFHEKNIGLVVFAIPEENRNILATSVASFALNQECDTSAIEGNILFILPQPRHN